MTDKTLIDKYEEHEYELRDIANYASTDPKGKIKGEATVTMTEDQAIESNYGRALNNHSARWIRID